MQGVSLRSVLFLVLALSTAAVAFHNRRLPVAAFGWSKRRSARARGAASIQGK